jgi:hypothetical protein
VSPTPGGCSWKRSHAAVPRQAQNEKRVRRPSSDPQSPTIGTAPTIGTPPTIGTLPTTGTPKLTGLRVAPRTFALTGRKVKGTCGHNLAPGTYQLTATPTAGASQTTNFTIKP